MGVASAHSEGAQRLMQLTQQVSEKLVGYVEEQVRCIESMGQGKIPIIPREANTLEPGDYDSFAMTILSKSQGN